MACCQNLVVLTKFFFSFVFFFNIHICFYNYSINLHSIVPVLDGVTDRQLKHHVNGYNLSVRFLRRRFKSFSNNPSQIIQHHLKKQQTRKEETSSNWDAKQVAGRGIIIRDRDVAPRASVIDLNQACVPVIN